METNTKKRPKRTDVLHLSPNDIEVEEGFNPRQDYGDIKKLAQQIRENNGIISPLTGFKENDGKYILSEGHRRLKASKILMRENPEILIPFIVDKSGKNPEQRIINSLICNEGLKLNPLEEAEVIHRLVNFGLSDKDIARKTGQTGVYISNLKLLYAAPQKIKNLILKNQVSSTLAMEVLREHKDYYKAVEVIENAVIYAKKNGKTKVVKRDLDLSNGKVNSYSYMRKCFKVCSREERVIRKDKKEIYSFAQKILNGEYTKDELEDYFYEPVKENS